MSEPTGPVTKSLRLDAELNAALGVVATVDRRSVNQTVNVLLWEALAARAVLGVGAPARLVELVEAHNRSLGIEG